MGKMTSNLMGSIASRALKGDLKAKVTKIFIHYLKLSLKNFKK